MSEINWKQKYMDLKQDYMKDVDAGFRLGFEQGQMKAQNDSVMQAQQQQAEQMQSDTQNQHDDQMSLGGSAGDQNSDPSAEIKQENPGGMATPDSQHPGGSELDQHISQLEQMVQKGEATPADLMKALAGFKDLRKSITFKAEMRKSEAAIPGIVKALHTPKFKISQQSNHNLSSAAKNAVSLQHKIVTDVMKHWAEEEKNTSKSILDQLKVEGLVAPKKD